MFFHLEWLIVGELDDVGLWLEQRLIYVHLRVGVDAIVRDVEMLDDLWLWKLVHDATARLLVLDELARYLINKLLSISTASSSPWRESGTGLSTYLLHRLVGRLVAPRRLLG